MKSALTAVVFAASLYGMLYILFNLHAHPAELHRLPPTPVVATC